MAKMTAAKQRDALNAALKEVAASQAGWLDWAEKQGACKAPDIAATRAALAAAEAAIIKDDD